MAEKISADFALFQSEFKKWQALFGLNGYKVYFKYEPDKNNFASIIVEQDSMTATVFLNSHLPAKDKPHQDIKIHAKHEAIHLLVNRLVARATERYVTPDDIDEAREELVIKLEGLLEEKEEW